MSVVSSWFLVKLVISIWPNIYFSLCQCMMLINHCLHASLMLDWILFISAWFCFCNFNPIFDCLVLIILLHCRQRLAGHSMTMAISLSLKITDWTAYFIQLSSTSWRQVMLIITASLPSGASEPVTATCQFVECNYSRWKYLCSIRFCSWIILIDVSNINDRV